MRDAAPDVTAVPCPLATSSGEAASGETAGGEAASGETAGGEAASGEAAGERRAAGPSRVAGAQAIGAIAIGAIAFLLLQILTYGYGRDQGIYAMVARAVLDGGMPYRDAFDFKPPGIFLIYAVARALFGPAQWGIRALEVLGLAGMCLAMVSLAGRAFGDRRVGVVAAALAVLVHAQLDFWHTAQPESFGGMLTVFALLAATPRSAAGAPRPAPGAAALIASGALFGAAGLLKPPLAGGGVVLAVVLAAPGLAELAGRGAAFARRARRSPARGADRRAPEAPGSARAPGAARASGERLAAPDSGEARASTTAPELARPAPALLWEALRPALLIALGGVLPVLACVSWFAAKGALGDLREVLFVFTPHYTALGWRGVGVLDMAWHGVSEWLVRYSGPLVLGLCCLLALHPDRHERAGVALLAGVIAMHLVGVVMQAKFFPYHYGATWPLTAMLAALGLWKAWQRCVRHGAKAVAALVAALVATAFARSATKDVDEDYLDRCAERVALLAAGARDLDRLDHLASVADVNAAANRAVAAWLRERVAPGRPVFVWGFEPVIYDLAERPPATRYLYNVPQRAAWARQEARDALMRDLAARPPAAIVVERRDVFPSVTGDGLDSRDTLDGFPALAGLLEERYELAVLIEDFEIYLER
ncbi:glycosyltransferase family 39 protein [Sorangium sp. So ce321]|uniref:glycosyltransferase family 39 protein n=1 Tax=Sorangium sp. So ce321 TaxID=3133300 RepID=UPI003F60B714